MLPTQPNVPNESQADTPPNPPISTVPTQVCYLMPSLVADVAVAVDEVVDLVVADAAVVGGCV